MIAADTGTWIAFLEGERGQDRGQDTELLDRALQDRQVVMVPVVLTELLSDPRLPVEVAETLLQIPMLDVAQGYWRRAGVLRAKVLSRRRKARLRDALIAQCCIDSNIGLITRDGDFRSFADAADFRVVFR
ncbi:MAG: PIN domain-containing protein [Candidatus Sulfotelmatobacter sp.]